MPIYEYRCEQCGRQIEVYGQTTDQAQPPVSCTCGTEQNFTRLFSTFAAHGRGTDGAAMPDCCAQGHCGDHSAGCSCCH
ncbi:MAG TPA: FmdB family zinc ribbon protein [bacterium]